GRVRPRAATRSGSLRRAAASRGRARAPGPHVRRDGELLRRDRRGAESRLLAEQRDHCARAACGCEACNAQCQREPPAIVARSACAAAATTWRGGTTPGRARHGDLSGRCTGALSGPAATAEVLLRTRPAHATVLRARAVSL